MVQSLYAYLPLVVAVLAPGLGLYVLARNPYLRAGRAFFLSMVSIGVLSLSHSILLTAPDELTALAFGRLVMFVGVLTFGSLWYLTSFLPYARGHSWPVDNPPLFWAVVIALAGVAGAAVDSVVLVDAGYGLSLTAPVFLGELMSLLLALGAAYTALTVRRGSEDPTFRHECILLAITPMLLFLLSLVLLGAGLLPLVASAFLVMGLLYAFLVLNHSIFAITSSSPVLRRKATIAPGGAILVKGRDVHSAYRLFAAEVKAGASGLVVSRMHPEMVREVTGLPDVPTLWLSTQPGPDRIDPTSLGILQHSISGFIAKRSPAVILLDGVEYLIVENSMEKVLRMLYFIRDSVTIAGSKLIVPLDPLVLQDRDLALVEKEFPVHSVAEA